MALNQRVIRATTSIFSIFFLFLKYFETVLKKAYFDEKKGEKSKMFNLKNYIVGLTFVAMLSLFLLKKIFDRNIAKKKRIHEKEGRKERFKNRKNKK